MNSKELPKPSSSNKQVQEYMTAVRKGANSVFVVQKHDGWSVCPGTDPSRAVVFATKEEALQKAKAAAKTKHGEVFVFDQPGSLISQEPAD